jgi:hypothetical protein
VCAHNDALREQVNHIIGSTWRQATGKNVKKEDLREALLRHPDLLLDLLAQYARHPREHYDFDQDPAGEVIWCRVSKAFAQRYPLVLRQDKPVSVEMVHEAVISICNHFKTLIEANGLWTELYSDGKRRHESSAQKLFYGISHFICEASNLDLTAESDAGRGPVDFKFSRGINARVLVEAKLSSNPQLVHGFETQVVEYQKAERTAHAVYLVILVDDGNPKRMKNLYEAIDKVKSTKGRCPTVILVDGTPKASASKA